MNEPLIVAVTDREYRKAPNVFDLYLPDRIRSIEAPSDESALADFIDEHAVRHVVTGVEPYCGRLYESLPRGAVIARYGVGFDGIDLAAATAHGLFCTNTPGVLEVSVAEYTMTLILATARYLPDVTDNTRNGSWQQIIGNELRGKRLAIIGCGQIGCNVARIASVGFGMDVVGSEVNYVKADHLKREFGFSDIVKTFAEAAEGADYVSLHIPSTPATRHFINARRLASMSSGSWLINTARGAVVDENDLYEYLTAGKITGAALDVFEHEPYRPVTPERDLRTLSSVIMTPHVASSTHEACIRTAERALRNIILAADSEYETMDLLNPEVLRDEQ